MCAIFSDSVGSQEDKNSCFAKVSLINNLFKMEISLELWYLLPISILIATIAMSSGIGGAVFFSPLFMLVLKLDPVVAIGTALITELFGFSSGLIAYMKAKLIDYKLGLNLLLFSVPMAILGSIFGSEIPPDILKAIFAVGMFS